MKDYSHYPRLLKTQQDKEEFMSWVSFLQLGILPKGTCKLQRGDNYCCLGVGCIVTIPEEKLILLKLRILGATVVKSQLAAPQWLKDVNDDFAKRYGRSLMFLNDGYLDKKGLSHPKIAELLLEVYGHELSDTE